MSNSTVSGNSTTGDGAFGGGILSVDGDLSVSNSTVSGNSTTGDGADGGGIFSIFGDLNTDSSIIANNTTNASGPDIILSRSTASGSNNLIGVGEGNTFTDGGNGNKVGTAANPLVPMMKIVAHKNCKDSFFSWVEDHKIQIIAAFVIGGFYHEKIL